MRVFLLVIINLIILTIVKSERTNSTLCVRKGCVEEKFAKTEYYIEGSSIACANYSKEEGWHIFDVETYKPFSNELRSYAAGFLEGYIYYKYINYHYKNIFSSLFHNKPFGEKTRTYINDQLAYTRKLISDHEENKAKFENSEFLRNLESSKMWEHENKYLEVLALVFKQYDGIYDGYVEGVKSDEDPEETHLNNEQFYFITMQADLEDIVPAFEPKNSIYRNATKEKECSIIVKYLEETENLMIGHVTHNFYTLMNRIFKSYRLNIELEDGSVLNNYKYSGRPGDFNSKDDYYLLSNNMAVLETSLEIKNLSIYKNLRYHTIPKWVRINVANKLAQNNQNWIELLHYQNSGTHNNQWIIIDFNKFEDFIKEKGLIGKKAEETATDIVHLVEQVPILDRVFSEDMTSWLFNQTYVSSYNAPFHKEVIESIGYSKINNSDYFSAHRYHLFKRMGPEGSNLDDIKRLMRYHDADQICNTIAPRCDLVENRPFGAVDAKVTDRFMIKDNFKSTIIYGPPHIKGLTEPFDFRVYANYSRLGIPDVFDFEWIEA